MKKKREDRFFFFFPMCLLARLRARLLVLLLLRQLPPTYIPFISSLVLFLLFSSWPCGRPPLVRVKIKKKNKEEKRENASKYFPSGFVRFSAFCISLVSILYYLPRLGPTQSPPTSLPGLMTTTGGTELLLSPPSFSRPLSPPPPLLSPPPLEATTPGTKS